MLKFKGPLYLYGTLEHCGYKDLCYFPFYCETCIMFCSMLVLLPVPDYLICFTCLSLPVYPRLRQIVLETNMCKLLYLTYPCLLSEPCPLCLIEFCSIVFLCIFLSLHFGLLAWITTLVSPGPRCDPSRKSYAASSQFYRPVWTLWSPKSRPWLGPLNRSRSYSL